MTKILLLFIQIPSLHPFLSEGPVSFGIYIQERKWIPVWLYVLTFDEIL